MTNVTPIQQPVLESLKNALQIAQLRCQAPMYGGATNAFADIARLLKQVIAELSEPNLAAMQAGEILLKEWDGQFAERRNRRDTIAGILRAQVTGEIPRTWETT